EDGRTTRGVMLHDRGEDARLELEPVLFAVFGDRDEVAAEEHAGDAIDAEQALRQRRALGRRLGGGELGGALAHHGAAGNEFQRRRIGRGLGLDEHEFLVAMSQSQMGPDWSRVNCQMRRRLRSKKARNGFVSSLISLVLASNWVRFDAILSLEMAYFRENWLCFAKFFLDPSVPGHHVLST